MPIETILNILFGAGGAAFLGVIFKAIVDARKGKLEGTEAFTQRIAAQSLRDTERANAAETRADEADRQVDLEVRKRRGLTEYIIKLRVIILGLGGHPPDPPEDIRGML